MAESLLSFLDKFVQRSLRGDLSAAVGPILSSSRLSALRKLSERDGPLDEFGNATTVTEEGTRPFAAGETLCRLVGKVLMRKPEVRKRLRTLQPVQCGVGVPDACSMRVARAFFFPFRAKRYHEPGVSKKVERGRTRCRASWGRLVCEPSRANEPG